MILSIESPKYGTFFVEIDDADYEKSSKHRWCIDMHSGKRSGKIRGVKAPLQPTGTIALHRYLLNAPKGYVVDHIDGNPLNNKRSNLRICTYAENARNVRKKLGATSAYKGVCWDKCTSSWKASISVGTKTLSLGRYASEVEAAKAYDTAAITYGGEFARINVYKDLK